MVPAGTALTGAYQGLKVWRNRGSDGVIGVGSSLARGGLSLVLSRRLFFRADDRSLNG